MATNKEIHAFAVKWLEKYRNPDSMERDVIVGFLKECQSLGFVMDFGKSFAAAFPDSKGLADVTEFKNIVKRIHDIDLLGATIFSKWRIVSYWGNPYEQLLEPQHRDWFIIALERLALLSAKDNRIKGQAKKIHLLSYLGGYVPMPIPGEEVEQRLTITAKGRVYFSGYDFLAKTRTRNYSITEAAAEKILQAISKYFQQDFEEIFATDVGSWEMAITTTDDEVYSFSSSIVGLPSLDGPDLTDLVRETLEMQDLFVFGGGMAGN